MSQLVNSILDFAPITDGREGEFIAYFNQDECNFTKPEKFPNYLNALWTNIVTELADSPFLKSAFFDFKQLRFGGRIIRFRFWILIMFFAEIGIFLAWMYYAYHSDRVLVKSFTSGKNPTNIFFGFFSVHFSPIFFPSSFFDLIFFFEHFSFIFFDTFFSSIFCLPFSLVLFDTFFRSFFPSNFPHFPPIFLTQF